MEKENHSQKLNFIDAIIINTSVGQEFKIYRKHAITNVQIKLNSFL